MNRQPYGIPPRAWPAKMSPWWVRLTRLFRHRQLRRQQKITAIECRGLEAIAARAKDAGILITPNHSAHYDSTSLYSAADRLQLPLYFMTAWQVFQMSSRWQSWLMQKVGCFSVDRESNDRQAFKQAVRILQNEPYPLVVFPEGDIYHTTDVVTPFREGAAAMAISAAKRSDRPVLAVPCGIKFWYLDDPLPRLHAALDGMEQRLYLRDLPDASLPERIHRLAEAALALKELDYLGHTREGRLRERVHFLMTAVIEQLEQRHNIAPPVDSQAKGATPPERVKVLRQSVIKQIVEQKSAADRNGELRDLTRDMDDLFFAMQLYSYPGDYLNDNPSIERLAETVDKFEEDILGLSLPVVRGHRRVVIQLGEPLEVTPGGRNSVVELTHQLQSKVQEIIDELNHSGA